MAATTRPPAWRELLVIRQAIRLMFSKPDTRARRIYELYSPDEKLTEDSYYLNMGYWEHEDDTLDTASRALVEKVGREAGFSKGDRVLDAGFGYGDQDLLWLEKFELEHITGLNITPQQTRVARERVGELGLSDRLDLREGSATAMSFEAESFDRVVALESAFHFVSREDFFRQSHRVLRPGGVLAAADIVPLDASPRTGKEGLGSFTYMIPDENWYDGEGYVARLKEAGFDNVWLTSIRDKVWEPWYRYAARRVREPSFLQRVGRIYSSTLRRHLAQETRWREDFANLDFVIAVAEKAA